MRREEPQRVRQLRLGRVDAAGQDVDHEVHALGVGEPVASIRGGQQRAQQVIGRLGTPLLQERLHVVTHLRTRTLDARQLGRQRPYVELALHPVRPLVQPGRVVERRAEHRRDRHGRVRLGERRDEVGRAGVLVPQPRQEFAQARSCRSA
jgi:hypothetical protein